MEPTKGRLMGETTVLRMRSAKILTQVHVRIKKLVRTEETVLCIFFFFMDGEGWGMNVYGPKLEYPKKGRFPTSSQKT